MLCQIPQAQMRLKHYHYVGACTTVIGMGTVMQGLCNWIAGILQMKTKPYWQLIIYD